MGTTVDILEVGSYKKLPHYSVIGEPAAFYVWVNESGRGTSSAWINGSCDLFYKLKNSRKKKQQFIEMVKQAHQENKK